jgi:hypothetical protein
MADTRWIAQTASHVLAVMEESRATWQMWHVRAEAERQVRTIDVPAEQAAALVDLLVDEVLDRRSIALAARDHIEEPETLRRVDGSSLEQTAMDLALLEMAANGTALDVGQASLVRQMCTSGARLQP